jgi:hypothetical protein
MAGLQKKGLIYLTEQNKARRIMVLHKKSMIAARYREQII